MSRVLFITSKPYAPWEGDSHRVRHTLEALASSDHAVELLTASSDPSPHTSVATRLGVPRLPFCRTLPEGPSVRRFALDTLMLFKAVHLAGRAPYSLIHGVDDGGVVAWLAGRITRTPCVYERHAGAEREHVRGPRRLWLGFRRLLERRALRGADAVIGSDASVVELLTRLGRRSRACVIPDIPSLPEEVPAPSRNLAQARFRCDPAQPLITCVGSHDRFQGLDLLFNAMPRILAAFPQARFVVVGGSDAEIHRMRDALAQAGIDGPVAFPGRMPPPELAALLAVSDVLVCPRRTEACVPVRVLDYLLAGRPIVAADTPSSRALLTPENALLTRPSPEALADGILALCRNPELGAALGRQGRATLAHHGHTPEAFRSALQRCYAYVLSTP